MSEGDGNTATVNRDRSNADVINGAGNTATFDGNGSTADANAANGLHRHRER